MRLRPYIKSYDFSNMREWITDERTHMLWCANRFPYPFFEHDLEIVLEQYAKEYGDSAYTVTDDDGNPIGFFVYNVNVNENVGFLKFVVVKPDLRGQGYGTKMIKMVLDYAYNITGVCTVKLNVFDCNIGAQKCYLKAGFKMCGVTKNAFCFGEEIWDRCSMEATKSEDFRLIN